MLDTILATPKAADLRVHVVWLPMYPGDDRQAAVETVGLIGDRRVSHTWDADRVVGRWFNDHVIARVDRLRNKPTFRRGVTWDTYLLFGKDGRWSENGPDPLIASGAPVVRDKGQLLGHFGIDPQAAGPAVRPDCCNGGEDGPAPGAGTERACESCQGSDR